MKKIPTLFKRDMDTGKIYSEMNPKCWWVIRDECIATEKFDGTACLIDNNMLYKRYNRKPKKRKPEPENWISAQEPDVETGQWPGWVPVGEGPEDNWHREGWENWLHAHYSNLPINAFSVDMTYELVGPKIQGNPYQLKRHELWKHGDHVFDRGKVPRTFLGLAIWLPSQNIEGIVWHHPDGRMAKVKTVDFTGERSWRSVQQKYC